MTGKNSGKVSVQDLVTDVLNGRISRRQAVKRAMAGGVSVSALLGGIAAGGAGAQATPGTPVAGTPGATPGTPVAVAPYQPTGPQVERLVFWTRSSPDTSRNEWDALTAVTTRYTELVGTPIELVTVPDADFRPRMTLAAPSGDGPDVFGLIAHDWLGEFAVQNIAQTWAPEAIHAVNDFFPSSLAAVSVDGQIYGVPMFSEALALMYNTNLVQEAPATWDALVAQAIELTSGDQYGFVFPLLTQYYQGPFYFGFGSYIFRYENGQFDTTDIGLNNEGGIEASKFLRDMYHKQMPPMPEAVLDAANAGSFIDGQFEAGQIAMTIAGPWREPPVTAAGIPYGVSTLPTLPNGQPMTPFVGYQAACVNAYSQNLEAAQDFISFMGSGEGVTLMLAGINRAPVRTSLVSAAVELNPNLDQWAAQAALGVPMPNIPAMSQVWTPWGDAMTGIVTNNVSDEEVQALMDQAVQQIQSAIQASQG
jgi:maltose-binding protein MalE